MKKISLEKIKKSYEQTKSVYYFPYGVNKNFDKQCDQSLIRFLDVTYYTFGLTLIFIPIASIAVLVGQKYGM
jgi:hypothetical protein|tara:strand:+ start:264 stop:479 length:216 start_codon:yes stop_codon:yes gene_type:complete